MPSISASKSRARRSARSNEIGPIAVVSDVGNNNGLVIGPAIDGWRTSGFVRWPVATLIDGHVVGEGSADSFPEGPLRRGSCSS